MRVWKPVDVAAASVMVLLEESDCRYILNTPWLCFREYFFIPHYKPLWNEVSFPLGSGKKGLETLFGGGEVVLLHQRSNGVPPAAAPLLLGRSCPSAGTKHRGTLTALAWDEDNNPVPLCTHCGSQAWSLRVGDIQAQHIPCVGTTPSSLVPEEGIAGGDHRVSRDPEPKVCWQELIPQLRAPSPHPAQIWCVTLTNRGAHFIKYLSCPAPVSNDGLIYSLILG